MRTGKYGGGSTGRKRVIRLLLAAACVCGVGLVSVSCAARPQSGQGGGSPGKYTSENGAVTEYAPQQRADAVDFSGDLIAGGSFDLAEKRGRVVVLNFWYASCPPCRKEAPELEAVYRLFRERNVDMVGVNIRDNAATTAAFTDTFGISYPNIVDADGNVLHSLSRFVPGRAIPTTLIFDGQGRVTARILGPAEQPTLKSLIDAVLKEEE